MMNILRCDVFYKNTISPHAIDLIKRMLDKDPDTRISIPEAREHPWFSSSDLIKATDHIKPEVIEKLHNFRKDNDLLREMKVYSSHMLKEKDVSKLTEQFKLLDTNNDGKITVKQIADVIKMQGRED